MSLLPATTEISYKGPCFHRVVDTIHPQGVDKIGLIFEARFNLVDIPFLTDIVSQTFKWADGLDAGAFSKLGIPTSVATAVESLKRFLHSESTGGADLYELTLLKANITFGESSVVKGPRITYRWNEAVKLSPTLTGNYREVSTALSFLQEPIVQIKANVSHGNVNIDSVGPKGDIGIQNRLVVKQFNATLQFILVDQRD